MGKLGGRRDCCQLTRLAAPGHNHRSAVFTTANLRVHKLLDLLLARQLKLILRNEELVRQIGERVLDQGVVFARTQQQPYGRVVTWGHHVALVPADVSVELAEVLVAEGGDLELKQDVALQDAVVEDEVDEAVRVADQDALLPSFEAEAVTKLEQELLQLVEQCVFQVRFGHHLLGLHAQEFEDVWITNAERGGRRFSAGSRELGQLLRILRQARALEVERADLALELANGPAGSEG